LRPERPRASAAIGQEIVDAAVKGAKLKRAVRLAAD
jgi:hypothetical protein